MAWIVEKIDVPSANSFTFELIPSERSLMLMKERKGPRIDPWVTPALILAHRDDH